MAILKDRLLSKSTQSIIETDVIVVKKTCLFKFRWKVKWNKKVNVITIIIKYAWMCYISRILNIPWVLNVPKFLIWQSSEYGRVLNMRAFHNVLNMPEHALTKFWMYLGFQICQDSNITGFWICKCYTGFWICYNMAEYVWIGREYVWIYDNRQGSEYGLYNT